ncbi:MAG: PHP domain-containing protein [Candidatus Heimdallarchaeota archaeon]|nr:PHP domain-containing protein [Candidatus Heimdallarchaeota archaeon]MCK4289613.1 PHP domain-containing protein [Candidatus Heimdallarchaeota archaeon]
MSSEKIQIAIDFHVHVDERVKYQQIPGVLRSRGLDGAGLLTHNDFAFAKKVTEMLKAEDKEKIYLAGVEVDTADGHIIAYGINEEIPPNQPSEETIEFISDLGGVSIIPHPFMSHNSVGWKAYTLKADAMEFYNGFAKIFLNFPNIMAKVAFKHNGFSEVGGSDAHHVHAIGTCYSIVEIDGEATEEKILEALRRRKTQSRKKPIDQHDIANFFKIIFTPKEGRKVVRFFDYF